MGKEFKKNVLLKGGKRIQKAGSRSQKKVISGKAVVDKNQKGFAFLVFENKQIPDAFVPVARAQKLFHGDRVAVTLGPSGVKEIKILERRFNEIVGKFLPHPAPGRKGQKGWVIFERKRTREEIYIPQIHSPVKEGDWIRVKLQYHEKGEFSITGKILANYGENLPALVDLPMIAAEFNLVEQHSKGAINEAKHFPKVISERDFQGRKDLRKTPLITIDGAKARDFDDAIFVERVSSKYLLWVAIADVSHYVREGSALDLEARARGTSVYFPERAFHMLPSELSENLCSLRPNEPRLTLVAKMEFDAQGNRTSVQLLEGVIQSRRRATYEEIHAERKKSGSDPKWEYSSHFELYELIRKKRSQRGSLDFEFPEAVVSVLPSGEVTGIEVQERLDSHRLIEEFMIAANEAVTSWMMAKKKAFVYRVHDVPSGVALERFRGFAATLGIKISIQDDDTSPQVLADMVRRFEGHPAQSLLNLALLRSLKQAVYSPVHKIHFGLASPGYTHFTSPIRRYPDLVVHRLLKGALQMKRQKFEKELADICEHCSYRERLASDAEREAIRLKQVRVISKRLGDEFEGLIVGMIPHGFFVQIQNPMLEGLVSIESMRDDLYEYDGDQMIFRGARKKRIFRLGDRVKVQAVRADFERRQIDFAVIQ